MLYKKFKTIKKVNDRQVKPAGQSIFTNKDSWPKQAMAKDLQIHYRDLIDYTKTHRKPVFIMRYARPDAVLISYELWEQICDTATQCYKLEDLTQICPQCSLILLHSSK